MNAYRKLLTCLVALFTLAGCGGRGAAPTPTLVPTPIVAQKPTYTVQRGTVTKSLELAGRVTPVRQQEMFFRTDGYVKAVYFQRGEAVKAGDVLAELETGDLAIQSAQAQLALQVAQAKLVQAQQENADALIEARLALDRANLQALQAGALGVAPSIAEAEASVARAEQKLARAETANREAQANRGLSEEEKAEFRRAYEEAKRQLENARALLIAETDLAAAQEAMQAAKEADQAAQTNLNLTDEEKAAFVEAYEKAKSAYVSAWMAYAEALGGKFPLGFSARAAGMEAALARLQVEKLLRGVDPLLALEVEQARLNLQSL